MPEFWERLQDRTLPTETVPLPVEGGTVSVTLRALVPAEWDALCEAHPALDADGKPVDGAVNIRAMRPALLAASIVAPEGSPPKDPAWWEALAKRGGVTHGELDYLNERAWALNRTPPPRPDLGKG